MMVELLLEFIELLELLMPLAKMYTIENKAALKSDYSPISYVKRFPV